MVFDSCLLVSLLQVVGVHVSVHSQQLVEPSVIALRARPRNQHPSYGPLHNTWCRKAYCRRDVYGGGREAPNAGVLFHELHSHLFWRSAEHSSSAAQPGAGVQHVPAPMVRTPDKPQAAPRRTRTPKAPAAGLWLRPTSLSPPRVNVTTQRMQLTLRVFIHTYWAVIVLLCGVALVLPEM